MVAKEIDKAMTGNIVTMVVARIKTPHGTHDIATVVAMVNLSNASLASLNGNPGQINRELSQNEM